RRRTRRARTRAAFRGRRPDAGSRVAAPAVGDGRRVRPSPRQLLCGNVRGRGQGAGLDLALDLVQLSLQVRRQVEVVDRVARSFVGDAERQRTALELALHHVVDRCVCRHVDLLEGAGDDRRVGVLLVGVDADAVYAGLSGLLTPPTAPITCWFFLDLPFFSSHPAMAPTMAPASCSLKNSETTFECLRSTPLASVPAPSMIAKWMFGNVPETVPTACCIRKP